MSDLRDDIDRVFDDLAARIALEHGLGEDAEAPDPLETCGDCLMPMDLCACDAAVCPCPCGKKEFYACDCERSG